MEWRVSQVVGEVRGESGRGWGRGYVVVAVGLRLVGVAGGGWVGGVGWGAESDSRPGDGAVAGSASPPVVAGPVPPQVDPELVLGRSDAPVTMVVFSDYQCPYCARFALEHQPVLVERYVETGQVRLVWRDYPYLGEESVRAAVAARAAGRQGRYWDYHEALYESSEVWRAAGASRESLVEVAATIGLDTDQFAVDLADPVLREAVEEDFAFALGLGVPGTPAFLIDGEAFFGAQPVERFAERLDEALGKRG